MEKMEYNKRQAAAEKRDREGVRTAEQRVMESQENGCEFHVCAGVWKIKFSCTTLSLSLSLPYNSSQLSYAVSSKVCYSADIAPKRSPSWVCAPSEDNKCFFWKQYLSENGTFCRFPWAIYSFSLSLCWMLLLLLRTHFESTEKEEKIMKWGKDQHSPLWRCETSPWLSGFSPILAVAQHLSSFAPPRIQ